MNKITTTTFTTFTLSDGRTFATRAEAQEAQDIADRIVRIHILLDVDGEDVFSDSGVAEMARLGKDLADALTLPARMGPKPKVKAPAAQA